jgi:putative addiction module CopG family antidote
MSIILNPELERRINELVASGRYKSAEEVLQKGLDLMDARDANLRPLAGAAAQISGQPNFKAIEEIGGSVPDEAWASLPAHLAQNLDHYLYGAPKEPE